MRPPGGPVKKLDDSKIAGSFAPILLSLRWVGNFVLAAWREGSVYPSVAWLMSRYGHSRDWVISTG